MTSHCVPELEKRRFMLFSKRSFVHRVFPGGSNSSRKLAAAPRRAHLSFWQSLINTGLQPGVERRVEQNRFNGLMGVSNGIAP